MIRDAEYGDLLDIVEMAEALFRESGYEETWGVTFDEGDAVRFFKQAIDDENTYIRVVERNGHVIGFTTALLRPWIMNTANLVLYEIVFFIRKEHRKKGKAAREMMKDMEAWAAEYGAVAIEVGAASAIEKGKISRFFQKQGFAKIDEGHIKRVGGGHG